MKIPKLLTSIFSALMIVIIAHGTEISAATSSSNALKEASAQGQFLLLAFYYQQDANLDAMLKQIDSYKSSSSKKIAIHKVNVSDPMEEQIVTRYGVRQAKLPLLLVFAPNGAITGGYEQTITSEKLNQCLNISDLVLRVLKPLQERKVVLVTLQNGSTVNNTESWQAVSDFASDPQYSSIVTAIKGDPAAEGSKDFIKQCGLITPLTESTVIVLIPPGSIAKILPGKISKMDILGALKSCSSGCGSGSSCSPK